MQRKEAQVQQDITSFVTQTQTAIQKIKASIDQMDNAFVKPIKKELEQLTIGLNYMAQVVAQRQEQLQSAVGQATAKANSNKEIRLAQIIEDANLTTEDTDNIKFKNQNELKEWLDTKDRASAEKVLMDHTNFQQEISDTLEAYYENDLNDAEKLKLAVDNIWPILNHSIKNESPDNEEVIHTQYTKASINNAIEKTVLATTLTIQEIAKLHAKENIKKAETDSDKVTKTAQGNILQNVLVYGPQHMRVSPYGAGQYLESDWHVVERNKGWGFRVGDMYNLDFETIWRTHIMDKYSRPYKDKDGNLVGGWFNKRFETDKWIPEENNMQLKPGQLRKDRPVENGNYEARMENYRGYKENVENWAESSFSKVKESSNSTEKKK